MTEVPLRVLCLDIEGGFGGSSRSLYHMLKYVSPDDAAVSVWSKKAGPIQARYADIGIEAHVMPDIPKVSSLPRFSRNVAVYAQFIKDWLSSKAFREEFFDTLNGFDIVHFNHEALFRLARDMKRRKPIPASMHIRTNLWDSAFARWQCRTIRDSVDALIFITENEQETFSRHCSEPVSGDVLYNVVEPVAANLPPWPFPQAFTKGKRMLIGCLSNYSWHRGLDRIVELATELRTLGRNDIGFVVAGNMNLSRSLPGDLGTLGRAGLGLTDYAEKHHVADLITFLGHIDEPERLIAGVDALIKPTRENNPWGRDILEALAAGRPVFSVGQYDRFVTTGKTGILQPQWDAAALARGLSHLADNDDLLAEMGRAAAERTARLCDGPTQANSLVKIWQRIGV